MAERVVKPAPLPCRGCERARRCAPGGQCIEIQDRVVRPTGYRGGFHRQPLAGCFTRRDGHDSDCTQPLRPVIEVGAARRCPVPIVHRRLIMLLLARVEGCDAQLTLHEPVGIDLPRGARVPEVIIAARLVSRWTTHSCDPARLRDQAHASAYLRLEWLKSDADLAGRPIEKWRSSGCIVVASDQFGHSLAGGVDHRSAGASSTGNR